ncbi:MAG: hypothetical protein JNK87_04740 [Bryobacterales bacterium]|nr:hypothetical protein [Bryobacterales bacterium]
MSEYIFRFNSALVFISTFLTVGVVIRLLQGRLWSRYWYFFCFLVFALVRLLVVNIVPLSRKSYSVFFITTEAINLVLYVLITLEIYSLLFERYPGIQSVSRWVTLAALGTSLLVATASLKPDAASKSQNLALDYVLIADRGVLSGMAVLILLMSLFLAWYPVSLPRNVVTHSILFGVYFLAKASVVLVRNLSSTYVSKSYNIAISVVGSICLFLWLLRLRPSGEAVLQVIGHQWNRADEEKLIRQLEQVNKALTRSARE